MDYSIGDTIIVNDKQCYLIDTIIYDGKTYMYVQNMENDELLETYTIFENSNSVYKAIVDPSKLGILLRLFAESILEKLGKEENKDE